MSEANSKLLPRFANSLSPVIRAALGVRDGEDDNVILPNHERQVVFAELRREINPAHHSPADAKMQREFGDSGLI